METKSRRFTKSEAMMLMWSLKGPGYCLFTQSSRKGSPSRVTLRRVLDRYFNAPSPSGKVRFRPHTKKSDEHRERSFQSGTELETRCFDDDKGKHWNNRRSLTVIANIISVV